MKEILDRLEFASRDAGYMPSQVNPYPHVRLIAANFSSPLQEQKAKEAVRRFKNHVLPIQWTAQGVTLLIQRDPPRGEWRELDT